MSVRLRIRADESPVHFSIVLTDHWSSADLCVRYCFRCIGRLVQQAECHSMRQCLEHLTDDQRRRLNHFFDDYQAPERTTDQGAIKSQV